MPPPIVKFPPIPTPPATTNAPDAVVVDSALLYIFVEPPIFKLPPIPAPPATINAPESVLGDAVTALIFSPILDSQLVY